MVYSDIVDYDKLDPFKEAAIKRFARTLDNPNRHGIRILRESIGATAVVIDIGVPGFYLAFNVEGLGTKNMISESMSEKERIGQGLGLERRTLFSGIGQDEIAMSVNDLGATGASPILFEPIVATGSSDYLTDPEVSEGLLDGFERGAEIAGIAIPGGETPTLKGIVYPGTIDLAGGSLGVIRPASHLSLGERLAPGLRIYGISSSGIHSNGVSLARKIAEKSREGYFTKLSDGKTLGQVLLAPTVIYTPITESLFAEGVDIISMQPITGHGWAKIMRSPKQLRYIIENTPEPQEEFRFLQENGPVTAEESYKTWNMGVGWIVFAPASDASRVKRAAEKHGRKAYDLGYVSSGEREVCLVEKNITFRPK